MKRSPREFSGDLIRDSLHRHLDPIDVPDLSGLASRVMQSHQPLRPLASPPRLRYASWALAVGVVAAGVGYSLSPTNTTPSAGPLFIGTASALNLAVPYLTQHHVRSIHVPTFLPFSQVASFKTAGPRVVPIVRAGTGPVPQGLIPRPTTSHTVYWIAISSQDAPVRVASDISQRATIATIDASPHPWLVIAASRHPFLVGGTAVTQRSLHFQLWNALQLKRQDGLTHAGSAITWKTGALTYTILIQDKTIPPSELVWLARTMTHTTLTKPEAFSLVYHALQKNARGTPTLSTWVFTAHPDALTHKPRYLTKVRWSTVPVRPIRGTPKQPGVAVILPEPALRVSIPVLLPRVWHSPYTGFYATVSSQFNPGGYSVSWTRTVAPIGTTTVDPMSTPFLTVTGGDLVSTALPSETVPAETPAAYWAQVDKAAQSSTSVADWVTLQGEAIYAQTNFTKSGPRTVLEIRYRGQLYQIETRGIGNAFPILLQMLKHAH